MSDWLIRNAELEGAPQLVDLRIRDGRIVEIANGLRGVEGMDAKGGAVLPGLSDHHTHIFALAARMASLDVEPAKDAAAFAAMVRLAAAGQPAGAWIRAIGYHERIAGELTRWDLDRLSPRHRLRLQHQSGSLWMLNTLALDSALRGEAPPALLELDGRGAPNGRIWRGDSWLRERIGAEAPHFAAVGSMLAAYGVTEVTDASASTTDVEASILAAAHRQGALPQRLRLMSAGALSSPADGAYEIGEVKILLDEASLPDLDAFAGHIAFARAQGRAVAVHCVTSAELAFALAGFQVNGAPPGSRIEHGSIISKAALSELRALGLTVIMQPSLIAKRGDRYLDETSANEQEDLYRHASLLRAGVSLAFSSDAPYGAPDPWVGIKAASSRTTASGRAIGADEAIAPQRALDAYLTPTNAPNAQRRRVELGSVADLCVLAAPLRIALQAPSKDLVAATFIDGRHSQKARFASADAGLSESSS